VLLGLGLPACAAEIFPRSDEVFRTLLADPRQIQLSAYYFHENGDDLADVALGHSWGLTRGVTTGKDPWTWQWDVEGMAFSRFLLTGSVNEFQAIDFFANLPIEVRRGAFSAKALLFHESSHLGDDYIRRTHDLGFRYSQDGLRALASYEPLSALRVYGGGYQLLHAIPAPQRTGWQTGAELSSPDFKFPSKLPYSFYLAEDVQSPRPLGPGNPNSYTVLGWRLGFYETSRSMRWHVGYFTGHSPYGQFFEQHENRWDLGVSFDL
jgi:hypothetical protein